MQVDRSHIAPETGQYCPPLWVVGSGHRAECPAFCPERHIQPTDDPEEFLRRLDEELRTTADAPTTAEGPESESEIL